uniref:Uncharacterized protein n=1 Tax=Pleodorina starrii TaxID=330485 RepID=M9P819_9CHLO|nr:hypothetical protein L079_pgp082 [Pleodorina starrii]AFY64397.1 hypothetical protein [Pleodorina starrii]
MKNLKLISLIGYIKPKIKEKNLMLFSIINITKLKINNSLANYYNFKNLLNNYSFQNYSPLKTKTCIMKLALLVIKKITQPQVFYILISNKQILNSWSFAWFQLWYSLIGNKNKTSKHKQIFDLTLKMLKKILFKKFFKKTQKFILFLKQKLKQNFSNNFSFFIKTLNFKIVNLFKFFGAFFYLFDFFYKILYFMCRHKNFFYKIQQFFDNFINGILIKNFFYNQQVAFVTAEPKLRWFFSETQKIFLDSQFYKLAKSKLCFKMFFFKETIDLDFCLGRYDQNLGYVRKLLHTFLFAQKILFYNFNFIKKKQLFLYLQKILQTSKAKKAYVDFFYFGLPNQRFGKPRFHPAEKKKINVCCKRNINNVHVKLRKSQVTHFKNIFNKLMQSIKIIFNQHDCYIITNSCFTKIKKILLKLASFITFCLYKIVWKSAKKQHTKISNKCLVNKYWIFIQKLAVFYFFEKHDVNLRCKFYNKSTPYL